MGVEEMKCWAGLRGRWFRIGEGKAGKVGVEGELSELDGGS